MRRLFLLLLLCPLTCLASTLTIRVCVADSPFAPLTMPDGSGQVQELMRRAAHELSLNLDFMLAERPQCLAKVGSAQADATLTAYLPERAQYASYPMQDELPDESRALAVARYMVMRRRGSDLNWDGHQFGNLGQQPVGVQLGCLLGAQLRQMGLVVEDSSSTLAQNLAKLVQNRVAVVIAHEGEGRALIAGPYRGEAEMLPQPFRLTPQYLVFNKRYYALHKERIDAYWDALRRQRLSPAYQQYLQHYPNPVR